MRELSVCVNAYFSRVKKWSSKPFIGKAKFYFGSLFVLALTPQHPILFIPYLLAMIFLLIRGIKILLCAKNLEFFSPKDSTEDGKQREYSALAILYSVYSTIMAAAMLQSSRSGSVLGIILTVGVLTIPPFSFFCLSLKKSERTILRTIKGRLLKTVACIISNYFGLFLVLVIILVLEFVITWIISEVGTLFGMTSSASAIQMSFSFLHDIDWKLWTPILCYLAEKMAVPLFIFLSTTIAVLILFVFLTPAYQLREMQTALSLTACFAALSSILALIWSFLFSDTISTYYMTLDYDFFYSTFPNLSVSMIDTMVEYGKQFDGRDFTGTVSNLMIVYTLGVFMARFLLEGRITRNVKKAKRLAAEIMFIYKDKQGGIDNDESKRSKIGVLYKKLKYRSADIVILPNEAFHFITTN